MGLDFIGSDVHFSYSGFHFFRIELAKSIGIDLEKMEGFGGNISFDTVNDGIKDFLNHSDCDGYLNPSQMKQIIPRLREIVNTWEDSDWEKERALKLANDMEKLVKEKKKLKFC